MLDSGLISIEVNFSKFSKRGGRSLFLQNLRVSLQNNKELHPPEGIVRDMVSLSGLLLLRESYIEITTI